MRENKGEVSKSVNKEKSKHIIDKKFSKLRHKALYIDLEYQEVSDIFKQAQKNFISSMFQYCSERKIRPPLDDPGGGEKKKNSKNKDEGIKDLYREIVKMTHPDKTANLSEEEIESRTELYNEAVKGKQEGDFWTIFKTALELDIPINNISFEYIEKIEKTIFKLEGKINKIKDDLMYKWYFAEEDVQLDIFDKITANQEKYE
jgi:hypothetical protein